LRAVPLVSVVVPVYNVEPYLRACLESIARQTHGELEVIVVDDGSTDGSAAIARAFAAGDRRFRVLSQPNGGLGNARNNGAEDARGEFLAFVDSDDELPGNAYELLLDSLQRSGSDFATGNVHRLDESGATSQAAFLARTFAEARLRTHVTRFRPLLEDRIAPNKLWRRSFWEAQGFRFPEGMLHEDIPVVVPAQFAAHSVDVVSEPVYLYRVREGSDPSITQRRAELRALRDRLRAIELVLAWFDARGMRRARRWYERSIVAHDLRYYLNVLDVADDEYRAFFLECVNKLLDGAPGRGLFGGLLAIDRLKWWLVRRRLLDELLEVLRFERERLHDTPPVRSLGRWYGDYPFRGDRRLRVPRSVYRLERELSLDPRLDGARFDGDVLRLEGYGFVRGLGAPRPGSQRVALGLVRPGRMRALRQRVAPVRMTVSEIERRDATAGVRDSWYPADWSGFAGTLDLGRVRGQGRLDLHVTVRSGGVTRRRARFATDGVRALRAVSQVLSDGRLATLAPGPTGQVSMLVDRHWMLIGGASVVSGVLELTGRAAGDGALELVGSRGAGRLEYGFARAGDSFQVHVPLAQLGDAIEWELRLRGGRISVEDGVREAVGEGLWLRSTRSGGATLGRGAAALVIERARWDDGSLVVGGSATADAAELVALGRGTLERHAFPLTCSGGRFEAVLPLGAPLRRDAWDLRTGDGIALLVSRLPGVRLSAVHGKRRYELGADADGRALLAVGPDLGEDEQGAFHQRRLRETSYAAKRGEPLVDSVVYASFGGRTCGDSPRAIHEELVRRAAALEHLWLVDDGMCRPPGGATVLRRGSREHHEAFARARHVVTNDPLPEWFLRRDGQVCLQTWHGAPLLRRGRTSGAGEWSHTLSPGPGASALMRGALGLEGELLETGLPRVDRLWQGDRADVRARLGVSGGVRVILYAPTLREDVTDRRGRHRLDLHLDLERLNTALPRDTVLLFRRHPRVAGSLPPEAAALARDVSGFPDATELLLAVDVLVTDYSSIMFDFAGTGRPMVFFAYDLDARRDELLLDYEATVPGPIVRTTDELAEALRATDAGGHEQRYAEFAARFCALDDGHAAARVVDQVFEL
jgi:CDP-glycerol glycerophosphotransferase